MNWSRRDSLIAGLVVIAGFVAGGAIAVQTRQASSSARVTVAAVSPAPQPTVVVVRTAPTPNAVLASGPTVAPTAARPPAAKPTVAAPPAPTSLRSGAWQIDETGTSVGTIVWSGTATAVGAGRLAVDVHKTSVGERAVGPCERGTHLRVELQDAAAPQRVPYHEINCSGAVMSGEMRIDGAAGQQLSGSFWSGGTQLGAFTASPM